MSELNHFAISSILGSEGVEARKFAHGQIATPGNVGQYFGLLDDDVEPWEADLVTPVDLSAIARAFLAVRNQRNDRGSPDLYVADPDRNEEFLAECRRAGIEGTDYRLNKALFQARKNNFLPELHSVKTSVSYERQAFACEFAATDLRYRHGASIDDILCDPLLGKEYERTARKITPGFSSFEYRWAILCIRKAGRREVLPEDFEIPRFGGRFKLVTDPIDRIPEESGVYLLYERQKLLYTRAADDLRESVQVHKEPRILGAITAKLWKPQLENFVVDFAVMDDKKSLLHAVEKKIIEDRHPVFNVPRAA